MVFFNALFGAGNYEVWLTVAAVGMLKSVDNDIPILLEAYTTLKCASHVYLLIQNHDLILRLLYIMLFLVLFINYPLVATLLSGGSRNNSCNPCSIVMY